MKQALLSLLLTTTVLTSSAALLGGKKEQKAEELGSELRRAPAKAQARQNPYAGRPEAVLAGKKLFDRHCASCHGPDGRGQDNAPDLRAPVIKNASPGTLFWFLRNGNIQEGMPAWSRLPDQQLWQLVTYLQSLD